MRIKLTGLRRVVRSIILESGIPIDPNSDPRDMYTEEELSSLSKEATDTDISGIRISNDMLDLAVNTYFDFVGRHQVPEDTWSKINEFEQSFPKLAKVLRARLENKL